MSVPQEFHKFIAPVLLYDEKNNKVLSSEGIVRSVPSANSAFFFADKDNYFVCGGEHLKVFDSLTGEELFNLTPEKRFKGPARYYPKGKIAYSECNTEFFQGFTHSEPSSFRIERILVVDGESGQRMGESFSVFSVPSSEVGLLFKFDLKERSFMSRQDRERLLSHQDPSKEILEQIESAEFLTHKDILVLVRIGEIPSEEEEKEYPESGFPSPTLQKFTFFALVDITTGSVITKYPIPFDPQGESFNVEGDIFHLPTGELAALSKRNTEKTLVKICLEGNELKLVDALDRVTFDLCVVYILPSEDIEDPEDFPLFAFTTGANLLELDEENEWQEHDTQVPSSTVLSPTIVASVVETDELINEFGDSNTFSRLRFLDVRMPAETDVYGDSSISADEVFWLGEGLTCVHRKENSKVMKFLDEDGFFGEGYWEPLFEFPDSRITRCIPLRNSKKWRKFMRGNLEAMAPVASSLAEIILNFL